MKIQQRPLVLYHGRCMDGFSGAWTAWKKFGAKAEYLGLEHQEAPPKQLRGRELYFIDFCYPYDTMKQIVAESPRVVVIDHHISQKEAVLVAHETLYQLDHSGCALAWRYFHPKKPIPFLLRTVEDNDLYTFKLKTTKALIGEVAMTPFTFSEWSILARKFENPVSRKKLITHGNILLENKEGIIDQLLENCEQVVFEGYKVYALNTPVFYSDAANAIYSRKKVPFAITWFYKEGKIHVSLRSQGRVDVSLLAKKYGGGGHKAASGFSVPITDMFPWETKS